MNKDTQEFELHLPKTQKGQLLLCAGFALVSSFFVQGWMKIMLNITIIILVMVAILKKEPKQEEIEIKQEKPKLQEKVALEERVKTKK